MIILEEKIISGTRFGIWKSDDKRKNVFIKHAVYLRARSAPFFYGSGSENDGPGSENAKNLCFHSIFAF